MGPSLYTNTGELSGRSWIAVVLGLLCILRASATWCLALSFLTSSIAFLRAAACYTTIGLGALDSTIYR